MTDALRRYYEDLNARRSAVPDPCCDYSPHSEEHPCRFNRIASGVRH